MYRSLKPGGYSIHQIGIDDHLTHFDSSQSPKKYISYSDNVWKLLFEKIPGPVLKALGPISIPASLRS